MLTHALAIMRKDIRLIACGGTGLIQPALLGLLLIFIFSLATPVGEVVSPETAAGIFWLASLFSQVLIFNTLYSLEEVTGARIALLLSPASTHSIWLGKVLASSILLLLTQVIFFPAVMIFLGQNIHATHFAPFLGLILTNVGLVVLGSLLGAMARGRGSQESLLTIIFFPLLIPLLMAGIKVLGTVFSPTVADSGNWISIILAFDAIFCGAALFLFPVVFCGDD